MMKACPDCCVDELLRIRSRHLRDNYAEKGPVGGGDVQGGGTRKDAPEDEGGGVADDAIKRLESTASTILSSTISSLSNTRDGDARWRSSNDTATTCSNSHSTGISRQDAGEGGRQRQDVSLSGPVKRSAGRGVADAAGRGGGTLDDGDRHRQSRGGTVLR